MSHDFEGAKAFYAAVFGYEYGDVSSDGFSYATLLVNGKEVGGIGAFPGEPDPNHRPFWAVYFGSADTDKSVETATANGGQVIRPASDSPYGRMAIVTDDQGALFSLISISAEE
jgi:predicted enzyme related to lactoylglutathione lyase